MSKKPQVPGRFEPVEIEPLLSVGEQPPTGPKEHRRVNAFVPDSLPPKLDLPHLHFELHESLIAAERALGQLEGTAHRLANPRVLIGPFARREAMLSSAIEDTFTTIEDLARVEANLEPREHRDDAIEVWNYVRALEQGLKSDLPISLRLIRDLHRTLLSNTRGGSRDPGNFRRVQNFIGRSVNEPRFVPPPVHHLNDLLTELERFIHAQTRLPDLVRIGMVHYQIEAIHPFLDGNGRIGRLLITLQLCQRSLVSKPLVYVSGYFEQHRAEYYDRLLAVSLKGEWLEWLRFFLEAVTSQAKDAQRRADDLLTLQQQLHEKVQFPRASGLLPRIIDGLFVQQWLTVSTVSQRCHVTPKAADRLIRKLESLGILKEASGATYGRAWLAPDVLGIIRRDYDRPEQS